LGRLLFKKTSSFTAQLPAGSQPLLRLPVKVLQFYWNEQETVHTGRYEMNFRSNPKGKSGEFIYQPYFFKSGNYKVFTWYPSSKEYESNVRLTVHHSKGDENLTVNQKINGGKWVEIGTFSFEKGFQQALTIHGDEDKYVIADAVKFEFVKE
jgi:hypothetical protein